MNILRPSPEVPGAQLPLSAPGQDVAGKPALLQYWEIVLRHKFVVMALIALGVISALIVTLIMTEQFTARSRIEVKREQDTVADVTEGRSDPTQDLEFYQTQYSLLEAESLAMRVARTLRLANDATFIDAFQIEEEMEGSGAIDRTEKEQLVVEALLDHVAIEPIRGSRLIDVYFTSPDPQLSARIVNAWVEQYVQAGFDRRYGSTEEARAFLQRRLDELRDKLEQSEKALVAYASSNDILNIRTDQDATGRTRQSQTLVGADLEALNRELAQATAARIQAQSRLGGRGAERDALDNLAINNLRERRAAVAADLAKMLAQFEPSYPQAQALQAQLDALDRSITAEEQRVNSTARDDYRDAVEREELLQRRVASLKGQFNSQEKRNIQFNIFQREVDTNRELYNSLLQRFKEVGVAGVGLNNVAIVDAARVPDEASSPRKILNLAIGLLFGMLIAGVAVIILEQIDESLGDADDVRRRLGLPLIGLIPDMEKEDIIESMSDKKSMAFESYITVATNLAFATDHGVPRTISLTSTRPNEGKSTSAISIANVLSQTRGSVILVDADMRNPTLHTAVGLDSGPGLSNFLAGSDDLEPLVQQGEGRLSYMAAGPIPPNAAELLSSDRMAALLRRLQKQFEHVIVDCPPVLGLADAPLIARVSDGTLFVVEASGAGVRGVQTAVSRLNSSGASILGVLLTKVESSSSPYGDQYGYGYGYGASAT